MSAPESWSPGQYACPACGRDEPDLPADHELYQDRDARGWPVLVCNYGIMVVPQAGGYPGDPQP